MNALKDRILPTSACALCVSLLLACASPTPAPVLLTLPSATPIAAAASVPDAPGSAPVVAVRRVNIPEYLVARRVRYRSDSSTLAEWPDTYWAERIEIGVSREFVAALRRQLHGWTLCDINCGDQLPALTVVVDLQPLDYLRAIRKLQARARITVSGPGASTKVLKTQDLAYELPSSGDSAQAQAQVMAELIEQVATSAAALIRDTNP
jgi:uncharacterized lipoprotein YmbA